MDVRGKQETEQNERRSLEKAMQAKWVMKSQGVASNSCS